MLRRDLLHNVVICRDAHERQVKAIVDIVLRGACDNHTVHARLVVEVVRAQCALIDLGLVDHLCVDGGRAAVEGGCACAGGVSHIGRLV